MKPILAFLLVTALGLLVQAQDTIKVDVELVQVYATVTDPHGRFVTDLKPADFKVLEDGQEQQIEAFSSDDSPISAGILFDVNGIMGKNLALAKESALAFLKVGNVRDDHFVMEFNDKPELIEDYTSDLSRLQSHTRFLDRAGRDSTLDAINSGLEKLSTAVNPRRVLLVFTSGAYFRTNDEYVRVRNRARQLDVQIYGISIADPDIAGSFEGHDNTLPVVESVGGETFMPDSAPAFISTCRKIAVGIRNQYIFGYRSTNPVHDGKYRRLQISLNVADVPDLYVHTRQGYYASTPTGGPR